MSARPVALITGASRGIGAATALHFARYGYDVCINYRSDRDSAESLAEKVRQLGVKALVIQADVSQEQDVVGLFREYDKHLRI